MPEQLDHPDTAEQIADLLDAAHAAVVALDRALVAEGWPSWPASCSARGGTLDALAGLAATRSRLDRHHRDEGRDPAASPFIRRSLRPTATTLAAARRAWAASWPRKQARVLPGVESTTSDGDRPGSLLAGSSMGPSAAALGAAAPCTTEAAASPTREQVADSEPLSATQTL